MSKRTTLEDAKQEFINRNYIPLFNEYKNAFEKLLAQTQEGYKVVANINNLKNNVKPNKFDKSNPYTIQNIKLWCKLNNKLFELISKEYTGNKNNLQWQCLKKECQGVFKAPWDNIYQGQNCACCNGNQTTLSNCLATKNPQLTSEWHLTKNEDLTPYDVTCGSHKKVWWICDKGHEWEAEIKSRNNNNCPYCAGKLPSKEYNLLVDNPLLCKEWDYEKNGKLPDQYTPNSSKKVWWICSKCNRRWEAIINSRNNNKNGCLQCVNSKANDKIIEFCKFNNLDFSPEFKIEGCKNKRELPFDVKIIYNNILYLIEADGRQHFEPVNFGGISDESALKNFKITQYHDEIKNKYCEDNKINLIRIPYWEFKNIKEILQNELFKNR